MIWKSHTSRAELRHSDFGTNDYADRLRRAAIGLKIGWLAEAGDEIVRLRRELHEAKDALRDAQEWIAHQSEGGIA